LSTYLAQCITQMLLESQPPHEIVNLLFTITNYNNRLAVLLGG